MASFLSVCVFSSSGAVLRTSIYEFGIYQLIQSMRRLCQKPSGQLLSFVAGLVLTALLQKSIDSLDPLFALALSPAQRSFLYKILLGA